MPRMPRTAIKPPWVYLKAETARYRCLQILSTGFVLDGQYFPVGSWIVQSAAVTYAKAMHVQDFVQWCAMTSPDSEAGWTHLKRRSA